MDGGLPVNKRTRFFFGGRTNGGNKAHREDRQEKERIQKDYRNIKKQDTSACILGNGEQNIRKPLGYSKHDLFEKQGC